MARRDRVTHLKSHRRKRNQNPKLSPFQREQKRARLANQAPTLASLTGRTDLPRSQRAVLQYLMDKKAREDRRKAERQPGKHAVEKGAPSSEKVPAKRKQAASNTVCGGVEVDGNPKPAKRRAKDLGVQAVVVESLNKEIQGDFGAARMGFRAVSAGDYVSSGERASVEERIARKKERKHKRKAQARRLRVQEKLRRVDEQFSELTATSARKKSRAAGRNSAGDDENRAGGVAESDEVMVPKTARRSKSIHFAEGVGSAGEDGGHRVMSLLHNRQRPAPNTCLVSCSDDEFPGRVDDEDGEPPGVVPALTPRNQLSPEARRLLRQKKQEERMAQLRKEFDPVHFGERVEAPPTFDVVPDMNAAISRLAKRMETRAQGHGPSSRLTPRARTTNEFATAGAAARDVNTAQRLQLLSSVSGLGEQKRLARLGLAASGTATTQLFHSSSPSSGEKKKQEMELLREKVMMAYQKSKQMRYAKGTAVNLSHQFPI